MKTINENTQAQIIEKKSKFISELYYVNSQEEAELRLSQIRKKYYDAKHHCFAYRICQESGILEKASDDGEPSRNCWSTNSKFVAKTGIKQCIISNNEVFWWYFIRHRWISKSLYTGSKRDNKKSKHCNRRITE